jgi:predicted nucleic-acid-binding protein
MIILVDANILLDFFQDREPFRKDAIKIIQSCSMHVVTGYIAAHSITNIFYILRKGYSADERKIMHNKYLSFCYEQLTNIEGSLVTFGFNFGEYDDHIIDAINIAAKQGRKMTNKLWSIYIGVYSDEDKKRIESIVDRFKCKVHIYDAKDVEIWR